MIEVIESFSGERLIIGNDTEYYKYLLLQSQFAVVRLEILKLSLGGVTDFLEIREREDALKSKIEQLEKQFGIEKYDHS